MGSLLHRLSVLNRDNPVAKGRCTQPVRNHNRCRILVQLQKLLVNLPQGMDTVLGKITEDGVDVSGGEWQRIAMARLYYQDAELKILDEPTAAIDPVREQQIYQKFLKLSQRSALPQTVPFQQRRSAHSQNSKAARYLRPSRLTAKCPAH